LNRVLKVIGETEWTKSGQYTGITELDLTLEGVKQVTSTAAHLVGKAKLIDSERVVRVWVSLRKRTQQTFHALFDEVIFIDSEKVTLTADIAKWDYSDYEGLLVGEIKARRKEKELNRERKFDIWRDGCEAESKFAPRSTLSEYR
jgi:broad specificity phosphatase PhoE